MTGLAPLDAIGLADDAEIAVDAAAMLLAAEDRPGLGAERALELLPDAAPVLLAAELAARDAGHAAPAPCDWAQAVARLVAHDLGIRGDRETYDAPENADLIAVLGRGRGLPVAIAILAVGLVRRAGGKAHVIGLPGHAIAQVGDGADAVWLDLFHGPDLLDAGGIGQALARALGRLVRLSVADLRPLSNRQALVRLVSNQLVRARKAGDIARARVLAERLVRVAPQAAELWWELARLEQLANDRAAARRALAAMRETTRDPAWLRRIAAAAETLAR